MKISDPPKLRLVEGRRKARRFPIECTLRYEVLARGPLGMQGKGKTVNMSSCGVLLSTNKRMAEGALVQVEIDWPVKRLQRIPMKLVIGGTVVRSEGRRNPSAGLEILNWEFRTAT